MRCAVLLLLTVPLLYAQPKPSAAIHGVVKDQVTGAPLPDVTISLGTPTSMRGEGIYVSSGIGGVTTDEEGRYTIPQVRPGSILVSASIKRGPRVSRTVRLADGDDLAVDFVIAGSATISGRVLDENDQPAVDAFVYLIQTQYNAGVISRSKIGPKITGEDGSYAFETGLEPGRTYRVLVDRDLPEGAAHEPVPLDQREPIEAPTYFGNVTSFEAATPIVLRPGQHHEQTDIKLRTALPYCADGKLEYAGKPAARPLAVHEFDLAGADIEHARLDSASDGTVHICGLTPGHYSIAALRSASAEFTIAKSDVHKLYLNADTATLHLDLSWDGDPPAAAKPGDPPPAMPGSLSFTMLEGEGHATREDLRKRFGAAQGSEIAVALDGPANGTAVKMEPAPFNGPFGRELNAGDYNLDIRLAPGAYARQITHDGVAVTTGVLHLPPGSNGTLRVIAAQGTGTLECQVADGDGNPLPDVTVVLIPPAATTAALLSSLAKVHGTDLNGKATISELAPGKYRVLALTQPYRQIPEDIDKLLLSLFKAQDVEVSSKSTANAKLTPVSIE